MVEASVSCARVLIPASIRITHSTPFNQQRLLALGCYLFGPLGYMHDFAQDLCDRVAVAAVVRICAGLPSSRSAKSLMACMSPASQRAICTLAISVGGTR